MEEEKVKNEANVLRGKNSRKKGGEFERKVRKDLEQQGWIIDKWTNNFDLEKKEITTAKRKFNPFMKVFSIGTGFPDFICFKRIGENFDIIFVEVKRTGNLDKDEKNKAKGYLDKKIVNKILIAMEIEGEKKKEIKYIDIREKYPKLFNIDNKE